MDLSDFISFNVFFISAILCLTFSTLLHIFINYSPRVLVIVSKLDYIGINILIFGSMVPVIHYLFYCYLQLKTIYIGILLVLSIASTIGTSTAACSKPRYRPFKAILFIALGLYGLFEFSSCSYEIILLSIRCCSSRSCMFTSWFTPNV